MESIAHKTRMLYRKSCAFFEIPSFSSSLYFCSLFLAIAIIVLRRSMLIAYLGGPVFTAVSIVSMVLLLLSELTYKGRTARKTYLICCLIVVFGAAEALITDTINIFFLAAFIVSARKESLRMIAKCCLLAVSLCCVIIVGSALCGITTDYIWVQGNAGDLRIRHGLGFSYTTYLGHFIFFGTLILFYLKQGRFSGLLSISIIGLAALVFFLTDTRNALILTLLVVACSFLPHWLFRANPLSQKASRAWAAFIPVVAIVSIAMMIFYTPAPFWDFLNDIFSHRLSISHRTFETFGMSWFGQDIDWRGNGLTSDWVEKTEGPITYIDNSFANIFMHFGVIFFVCLVVALAVLLYRFAQAGNRVMLFVFAFITLNAFFDSFLIEFYYNIFILSLGTDLLKALNDHYLEKGFGRTKNLSSSR